jgi:hypothetical protein
MSKPRLVAVLLFVLALLTVSALGAGWKWRRAGNSASVERVAGWTWSERAWRAN